MVHFPISSLYSHDSMCLSITTKHSRDGKLGWPDSHRARFQINSASSLGHVVTESGLLMAPQWPVALLASALYLTPTCFALMFLSLERYRDRTRHNGFQNDNGQAESSETLQRPCSCVNATEEVVRNSNSLGDLPASIFSSEHPVLWSLSTPASEPPGRRMSSKRIYEQIL